MVLGLVVAASVLSGEKLVGGDDERTISKDMPQLRTLGLPDLRGADGIHESPVGGNGAHLLSAGV